jgi:hypothetical protein
MTSTSTYHYVYRISNRLTGMHYYGVRTSKIDPKLDLGSKYFSSSRNKEFMVDQKTNPSNYKYKVVRLFSTRQIALDHEIVLHKKFDVGVHAKFYNRAKSVSNGFDVTGTKFGPRPEEVKKKISLSNTGKIRSESTKQKMSLMNIGKIASYEAKSNMSNSQKGKFFSTDTRQKISLSKIGVPRSIEVRKKISEANMGKRHSDEAKSNMSNSQKGKITTQETKDKLSIKNRDYTTYTFVHINGEVIISSAFDLATKFNLVRTNISNVIRGKRNRVGGWSLQN